MQYLRTYPTCLIGKISYFYSFIGHASELPGRVRRYLPTGRLDFEINLGDPILRSYDRNCWKYGPAMITGLHHQCFFAKSTGKIHLVGASFEQGYASLFLHDSTERFSNSMLPADQVFPCVNNMIEALRKCESERQRHQCIERFLFQQLVTKYDESNIQRVSCAVELIHRHNGNIELPILYQRVFMSERNFRRKFLELVGLSPKRFSGIERIRSFVKKFKIDGSSYMDLVHDLGYSDQSHLIHDFRRLAGITPGEFFKKPQEVIHATRSDVSIFEEIAMYSTEQ